MLRLSIERERRGLSRTKLGLRADMNPVYVGQIELGRVPVVWPAWRERLSHALGLPEHELFDEQGHPLEVKDGDQQCAIGSTCLQS
jgi:transcriptional regulator with XRE-family HTH domain